MPWLPCPHLQSLFSPMVRDVFPLFFQRITVPLPPSVPALQNVFLLSSRAQLSVISPLAPLAGEIFWFCLFMFPDTLVFPPRNVAMPTRCCFMSPLSPIPLYKVFGTSPPLFAKEDFLRLSERPTPDLSTGQHDLIAFSLPFFGLPPSIRLPPSLRFDIPSCFPWILPQR